MLRVEAIASGRWSKTRKAALAMLILFAAGQTASLAHWLCVRHAICLEHGEMIELSDIQAAAASAAPRSTAPGASPMGFARAVQAAAYQHDHCVVAVQRRESMALRPPLFPTTPAFVGALLAEPLARSEGDSDRILLAAPKTSPPV